MLNKNDNNDDNCVLISNNYLILIDIIMEAKGGIL